jgi:DNA replication ATP-dependent helicase Dna2
VVAAYGDRWARLPLSPTEGFCPKIETKFPFTHSRDHRDEMARFLNDLRDLVLTETAAQRRQIHTQWEKPLASRVADGFAIENVRLVKVHQNDQVELACARNQSRFRPGDVLCLSRNDPFNPHNVMVSLVEDEETRLLISSDDILPWQALFVPNNGWTLDIGLIDPSSYILDALAEAGDSLVGRERILPLLMGYRLPQIDPGLYDRGLEMGETVGLNWNQSEALANAYATDLAYLVQGPPGTGKTRVLATLVNATGTTEFEEVTGDKLFHVDGVEPRFFPP